MRKQSFRAGRGFRVSEQRQQEVAKWLVRWGGFYAPPAAQALTEEDIILDTRFGGPEYGLPNEGTMEAIRLCARTEGMLTDPVYEGKSMDGMIQMARNGEFPEGSRVLYAHLGGAPALSAYSYLFKEG